MNDVRWRSVQERVGVGNGESRLTCCPRGGDVSLFFFNGEYGFWSQVTYIGYKHEG